MNKKANNVSPYIHNVVTEYMTNKNCDSSKKMLSNLNFITARKLLADLPIIPTNERVYDLTQQIEFGLFNDISDVSVCDDHWEEWLKRTTDYLYAIGVFTR